MQLLEFPHSPYCEKARWALDHKGVPFQAVAIMPGFHVITVRRYAPDTSVPVFIDNSHVTQGSSEITDYLEQKYPANPLTPVDADERKACLEIEKTADKKLGENLRRILYYRLLAYPDFVRYCFTHPMSHLRQLIFSLYYPLLRHKIYKEYVISTEKFEQSKEEFHLTVDKLKKHLEQKQYLVGEQFTRADIAAASMLSLLVMPPEHPLPWKEIPDPQLRTFVDEFRDNPVFEWARNIYRNHRLPKRTEHK